MTLLSIEVHDYLPKFIWIPMAMPSHNCFMDEIGRSLGFLAYALHKLEK